VTVGDRLTSSNRSMGLTWTSTSTVTAADPGRCFAFAVNGTEHHPTALDLRPDAGAARRHPMRYTVVLDDGPSMFDAVSGGGPPRRAGAVIRRLDSLAEGMQHLLDRLDHTPAAPAPQPGKPDRTAHE